MFAQALALIELYNAPDGRYKQDVYLLPKKMGKSHFFKKRKTCVQLNIITMVSVVGPKTHLSAVAAPLRAFITVSASEHTRYVTHVFT